MRTLIAFMLGIAVAVAAAAALVGFGLLPGLTGSQPTPTPIADVPTLPPDPTQEPTLPPEPTLEPTAPPEPTPGDAATPGGEYTVRSGDSLSAIGTRFGVPWLLIAEVNGIEGPNYPIYPGQVLVIPVPEAACAPPGRYLVQTGDTLDLIAYNLQVSIDDLVEANGITDVHRINAGDCLIVPGHEPDDDAEATPAP